MDHRDLHFQDACNRRLFLGRNGAVGLAALASLGLGTSQVQADDAKPNLPGFPHVPPKAKRIIYLFQSGAPSQMDLFDPKPLMQDRHGEDLPESIRQGQRLTTMTSGQKNFPVAPSIFKFAQHGESRMWFSELMPHMSKLADRGCMIRSMHTEAINHDPAITFCQTGAQLAGRPSIGAWVSYGLGSEQKDLPAYVVLTSFGSGRKDDQPLYDRLWGSVSCLRSIRGSSFVTQAMRCCIYRIRPVLMLARAAARSIDWPSSTVSISIASAIQRFRRGLRSMSWRSVCRPAYLTCWISRKSRRAFWMLTVPMSNDRAATRQIACWPGDWPSVTCASCNFSYGLGSSWRPAAAIRGQCHDTDQATAALINDLDQRGLLDDTLIVWGGEFGRTIYSQGSLTKTDYGRDHHPRCFTILLTGAGIRGGLTLGETDDYCYNILSNPVHVHDLNATILHLLGVDHQRLTYRYQGRDFRLTDIHGNIVKEILA